MNEDNTKLRPMDIPSEIMDYLSQRFEIRDHIDIFAWSVRMLYDISKLDEGGWRLSFQKCDVDQGTRKVTYKDYIPIHYSSIDNLTPTKEGFRRMPLPEMLDETQKIKK